MSDNELIFASLLLVFLPLMLLRMTLKFRERKLRLQGEKTTTDNSLTTAELEALIEDAVHRNLAVLEDRIDRLEHAVFGEGSFDEPLSLPGSDNGEALEELPRSVGRPDRPRVR